MKKLLVLALVLGIAGFASASLQIAYNAGMVEVSDTEGLIGGINAAIGIIGPASVNDQIVYRTVNAPVAAPTAYLYTGPDAVGAGLPYDGGWVNVVWGDATLTPAPAGFWFAMPLPGYSVTTANKAVITVDVTDGSGVVAGSLFLAPEPMTMVLLGLGGLFLRRK